MPWAMAATCAVEHGLEYNDHNDNTGYNYGNNYDSFNYNNYGLHAPNSRLQKRTIFLPPLLVTKKLLKVSKIPIG